MPSGRNKLTNSTDETNLASLYSGDVIFGIPYFQRAYKWTDKNITRFENDLDNLLDYEDTSHFLGAIIIFGKAHNPSDPDYYEVIDGQQRLTTCYLALIALARVFSKHGMIDDAFGLYQKYLIINRQTNQITNAKLICCKEDRASFNHVFRDLTLNNSFRQLIQNSSKEYKQMPDTGSSTGRAWKNYSMLVKFFENKYLEEEKEAGEGAGARILLSLYSKLVDNMSMVQIVVIDPTDGPKIFDSLNSKQEPMTIGDLVRNEVFSKYADHDDEEIDALDRDYWHPFYEKFKQNDNSAFDKVFEQYFFPYVLTQNHNIKKADAFNYLREQWAFTANPKDIINALAKYQNIYIDLYYGTNLTGCSGELQKSINRLSKMGTPSSVYPFIMQVIKTAKDEILDVTTANNILKRIESFLVRRVVCGYEPTGLHAVFKSLWNDCDGEYTVEKVVDCIKQHYTVKWPDNEEFSKNIKTRQLYNVRITPFLLAEWNGHLGGDIPEINSTQIEHVLPVTVKNDSQWAKDWPNKEQRDEKKDCLANLLPISGSLNESIQNADYIDKRQRYIDDSALKAPRDFANKYCTWTPNDFDSRTNDLADWALERWPY